MAGKKGGTSDPGGGPLANVIETVLGAPGWVWNKLFGANKPAPKK